MLKWTLLLLLAISCRANAQSQCETAFDSLLLKQYVEYLSADSLQGRFTGSPGAESAAHYIAAQWERAGLRPFAGDDYLVRFTTARSSDNYNVMALLPGKSKKQEYIIFSAHYDHIGNTATGKRYGKLYGAEEGDTVFNGANDDASGVAALLALAHYFNCRRNNERSLLFIAFAGEEQGLNGSSAAAKNMAGEKIKAMINFEMIGRGAEETAGRPYITGFGVSGLPQLLRRALATDSAWLQPDPFTPMQLFLRSDNAPFVALGVPAHTIARTSPMDPLYHSLNDEAGTLEYGEMSRLLSRLSGALHGLVAGTVTPSGIRTEK